MSSEATIIAEFPANAGGGTASEAAYTVEARCPGQHPMQVGNQLFGERWCRVAFEKTPGGHGVPDAPACKLRTIEHGMHSYAAAQALRWWLHAQAEFERGFFTLLETRLVEHAIETSHKITAVGAHQIIGSEDRSSTMPNWGERSGKPRMAGERPE
jgi:hypothetical protein